MVNYKYLTIVNWSKRYIEENHMSTGDKFFSEAELCEIHNVSRQTVRQALAVLEQKSLLVKKRGSGTYIQKFKNNHSNTIPMVGVILTFFNNYIFPEIISGIEQEISNNNFALQLYSTHNSVSEEARALEAILAQNIEGVIVEPSKSGLPNSNELLYQSIRESGIPLLFLNTKYPFIDFPVICMDNVEAGRIATEHLVSLGHKKISLFLDFEDYQAHQRYRGYTDCLIAHNIPFDEKLVLWYPFKEWDNMFTTMSERILYLLENSTGIVCYNDMLAVLLIEFCKQKSIRVPDDLSIVGIDDSNLAASCVVPLSSVKHPKQKLGKKAAEFLLHMIQSGSLGEDGFLFRPTLVARESTSVPKRTLHYMEDSSNRDIIQSPRS